MRVCSADKNVSVDMVERQVYTPRRCKTPYSLIAQLVEQATVNRRVVGSSPTQGAIFLSSPTDAEGR